MTDAKVEPVTATPLIKLDPASTDSPARADVDDFEEDFTLDIPTTGQQAWLVKLPRETWAAWKSLYDNAADDKPIEIGKMRVFNTPPGREDEYSANPRKRKIQIRLDEHVPAHADLPKNYNVLLHTEGYNNTAVFSEKHLPGHRPGQIRRNNNPNTNNRLLNAGKPDRYSKYRTAIPKQTALAPIIHHEAQANPIEDESYMEHLARQWQKSIRPKAQTQYLDRVDRNLHPGASHLSTFTSFGMSARPGGGPQALGKGKKPAPKEKAVRMSQEDLLDALYRCFRRYRYWSLKALRKELKQPESYVKATLEEIAVLIRSGDFALTYDLKPEYRDLADVKEDEVKEEVAEMESAADTDFDVEDDDVDDVADFEDVKMDRG